MWLRSLLHLVLMLIGFGFGSFAWTEKFDTAHVHLPSWWIGGALGLAAGWICANLLLTVIRTLRPSRPDKSPMPVVPEAKAPTARAAPKVARTEAISKSGRSDAITLLAALQREARFIDFVQESLAGYSDAQIGAVARDVHRDCGAVLARMFALRPASAEEEGKEVDIPKGFDSGRWRLTGDVTGEPPFHGRLVHPGWEATICELPTWSGSTAAARVVAPAEVELQ